MTRTSALFAALALVLPTASFGQSSDSSVFIDQVGEDNAARIVQNGDTNRAGSDAVKMFQDGNFNSLSILQSGQNNTVGLTAPGILQLGRSNTESIFNTIDIEQTSDLNSVGSVSQSARGAVPYGTNSLRVRQGSGEQNRLNTVIQTQEAGQSEQVAIVEQFGTNNVVDRVEQYTTSVDKFDENRIRIKMTGNFNGSLSLGGFAAIPDTADNSVLQQAGSEDRNVNGNFADLIFVGDNNRFGVRQGGRLNSIGVITTSGNANQIGLRQDGTENTISVPIIEGDDNNIGMDQVGTNFSVLDFVGKSDNNQVSVYQYGTHRLVMLIEGDDNLITARQDYDAGHGGDNKATVNFRGSANAARLSQFGGKNLFTLDVSGNENNTSGTMSPDAQALGLQAGYFLQVGTGNSATMTVEGDRNLFATSQTGLENMFTLTVMGDDNEAALLQNGARNSASLRQQGKANYARIQQ